MLQARFAILRGPTHFLEHEILKDIMNARMKPYNTIVETEQDVYGVEEFNYDAI